MKLSTRRPRRSVSTVLSVLLVASTSAIVPGMSVDAAEASPQIYLIRHVASNQYLSTDGWGPSVLVSGHTGRMAEWERVDNADGTVAFRNHVSGQYLTRTATQNPNEVGMAATPSSAASWNVQSLSNGIRLAGGGSFLAANGFKVRTSTGSGPQATWELVPITSTAPRFVTLTNEASRKLLAVSGVTSTAAVVTADFGGRLPAVARWELIEQITSLPTCDRNPAWKTVGSPPPGYGNASRLTTCFVLRNRALNRALDGNTGAGSPSVTTDDAIGVDSYWILSDIAAGRPITVRHGALGRYLADVDSTASTVATVTANSTWTLSDVDAGCLPLGEVRVDSHRPGDTIDTSQNGSATGSFVLWGAAPPDATSLTIESAGEVGVPKLEFGECSLGWSIEVVAVSTGTETFTVVSNGPSGIRSAVIQLNIIAPSESDVLVQPQFANTPQFHDRLLTFDATTGTLVFQGDVSDELSPGDGLGSGISPLAPNGYLRIVESVSFDGTNTVVGSRQAGITELIRQIEVHYRSDDAAQRSSVGSESTDVVFSASADGAIDGQGLRTEQASPVDVSSRSAALAPIGDGVDLTLDLNLDPGADFDLEIGWRRACRFCPIPAPFVKTFAFEVSLAVSAEVELVYSGATLFQKRDNFGPKLDDFRFATITVPTPIGVPIVVTFEAESQPFYDISIDAIARIAYQLTVRVEAGYEYKEDGSGRGAYRDASFDGGLPSLDLDVGIRATVAAGLEVDIEGLLYGQAGIELEATPRLEFEAIGDVIDREVTWDLKLVVPFEAGIEIEIKIGPLGWESEIGDLRILELSLTLLSGVFTGGTDTALAVTQVGPPGVFPGQQFDFTITVRNTGQSTARNVQVVADLPGSGSFVSSTPAGSPTSPSPGGRLTIPLGDLGAGATGIATVRWRAPQSSGGTLTNTASASAANSPDAGPVSTSVEVGLEGRCNPCGAVAAGTGLRNRSEGSIQIAGLPAGAQVTRAVLVWGILYSGATPRDTITLNGTQVTADVAATVSGTLCWGDNNTIGYAADVTSLVTGNGEYVVSDPPRGITRVDSEPAGQLPYTDGASLIVFFVGGGANNQVISDFTYNTNTDATGTIIRQFSGVNAIGLGGTLIMAGPDGQNNGSESFTISGSGSPITLVNTWDGSDSHDGPAFAIGNLWDTDAYNVSSVVPAGQTTLQVEYGGGTDCIGVGAAVLQVPQG